MLGLFLTELGLCARRDSRGEIDALFGGDEWADSSRPKQCTVCHAAKTLADRCDEYGDMFRRKDQDNDNESQETKNETQEGQ